MLSSRQIECGILEAEQQFKDCWSKLLIRMWLTSRAWLP